MKNAIFFILLLIGNYCRVFSQFHFIPNFVTVQKYDYLEKSYEIYEGVSTYTPSFKDTKKIEFSGNPNYNIQLLSDNKSSLLLDLKLENRYFLKSIISGHEWLTYKLYNGNSKIELISFCNYNNDLFIIYNKMPLRVIFFCKDTRFNETYLDSQEKEFEITKVEKIDPSGRVDDWSGNDDYLTRQEYNHLWNIKLYKDFIKFQKSGYKTFKILSKSAYESKDFIGDEYKTIQTTVEKSFTSDSNDDEASRFIITKSKNSKLKDIHIAHIMRSIQLHYVAKSIEFLKTISIPIEDLNQSGLKELNENVLKKIIENYKLQNELKQVPVENISLEDIVYTKVENEAEFPGGNAAWLRYLQKTLGGFNPADNGAPGGRYSVIVKFIVSKDGSISDVQAETNHGYGMEKIAIKCIEIGPKWKPALQNGRNVNAYRRQPFTFMVDGE